VPSNQLAVTFDQPLLNNPAIDTGNWTVRIGDFNRTVPAAQISAGIVVLMLNIGGADVGIDRVSFSPPPDDVLCASGAYAAPAFVDFPVTL
jgi:hypothetical protein